MTDLLQLAVNDARALTDQIKTGVEAVWHLITRAYTERAWSALGYSSWDDYCTREFGTSRLRLPREDRSEVVSSLREAGLSIRAIAAATGNSVGTIHAEIAGVQNRTPVEPTFKMEDEPSEGGLPATEGMCIHCGAVLPLTQLYEIDHGYECDSCVSPGEPIVIAPRPEVSTPRPITGLDGKTYQPTPVVPKEPRRKAITESFDTANFELRRVIDRVVRLSEDDRFKKNKDQIAGSNLGDLVRARDALSRVIQQIEG